MSDFSAAWSLSRSRLIDTISDLSQEQLNWKIHPLALSIGQGAIHVAGVELSFASQLLGRPLSPAEEKLKSAATEGVVNDRQFPYSDAEITPELVQQSLALSRSMLEPLITEPSEDVRQKSLVSALGPVITGEGAFARLSFHAAYHQGQSYLIREAPGFPSGAA